MKALKGFFNSLPNSSLSRNIFFFPFSVSLANFNVTSGFTTEELICSTSFSAAFVLCFTLSVCDFLSAKNV
jgi:hypothetical protein